MSDARVRIENVVVDPPYTVRPDRIRYRVTLTCGCSWWEDYALDARPPAAGDAVRCNCPRGSSEPPPAEN